MINGMPRFQDRAIVLTGVGREGQAGEVVARAFAEEGATLALVDVDAVEVERRASSLRDAGFPARAHECNLTDPAQVDALAGDLRAAHGGRIDALVNMAGGFAISGPVADSDIAVWRRQFSINLDTAYLATRGFLPLLRASRGAIVCFASAAALPGGSAARMSAYVAAKSGVIALVQAVAEEERDTGVRINAVAPTAIRTAANTESMGTSVRYVEREEVARTVLWLCSTDASAVTGQIIRLA
jgi:NAD(P)-dependent dehydrogenase (short-subunit alcohol dehydrogenase family)